MLNSGIVVLGDSAIYENVHALAQELYQFVSKVQKPKLNDQDWMKMAQTRCAALAAEVSRIRKNMSDRQKALTQSLEKTLHSLQSYMQELSSLENGQNDASSNLVRLRQRFQSLSLSYEELVIQCRRMGRQLGQMNSMNKVSKKEKATSSQATHFSHLKPSNYARNTFHILMGVTCAFLYQFILDTKQALFVLSIFTTLAVTLEVGRKISKKLNRLLMDYLFKWIARPREEHHINSATFYVCGLSVITFAFPKTAVIIGVLVLAFADPMAALVGKRWGKKKLWREKSYVGTAGFFFTATAVSLGYLGLNQASISPLSGVLLSLAVASAGTIAEVFSEFLDDNFTIPVLCAGIAALFL